LHRALVGWYHNAMGITEYIVTNPNTGSQVWQEALLHQLGHTIMPLTVQGDYEVPAPQPKTLKAEVIGTMSHREDDGTMVRRVTGLIVGTNLTIALDIPPDDTVFARASVITPTNTSD
jgi:hypothetical protein